MLWIIHCLDGADVAGLRKANAASHSGHLKTVSPRPLVYGPLLADDGEGGVGSLFVIDAPDRAAAERWVSADPFHTAGVWQEVRIHRYRQSPNAPVRIPVQDPDA